MRVRCGHAATHRRYAGLGPPAGAVPLSYAGTDFASAVAAFVREYGITHILLGRTQRPWYRRWFGQSPLGPSAPRRPRRRCHYRGYSVTVFAKRRLASLAPFPAARLAFQLLDLADPDVAEADRVAVIHQHERQLLGVLRVRRSARSKCVLARESRCGSARGRRCATRVT